MGVMYESFGSNVRHLTFGCYAMGSVVVFILRSRLLLYSAGSGLSKVQFALSRFSAILFCLFQSKLYVCISWLHSCLCV